MSYNNAIPVVAATDLSAFQHRVLNSAGTLATGTPQARGILDAKVESGDQATLVYEGRHKFQAGGAIGALAPLNVASGGFVVVATSGDAVIGINENAAVTSGSYGDGVFNFLARTMTTSEG